MRVKILGKHWNLRLGVTGLKNGADCDPPWAKNKQIRIGPDQENEMEFIIHESFHGGLWWLDEEWVGEVAADVAQILKRLGYRKV